VREIERNPTCSFVNAARSFLHSSNPPLCAYNENAYANDQVFNRLTHPLTICIANNLECTRTPANLRTPSTTESTTIYFGQRCGCGTGCEGEDGVDVVFEGRLGMGKKAIPLAVEVNTEALALSSSKGCAPLLRWSRGVSPTKRHRSKAQRPDSRNRRGSYLPGCRLPAPLLIN
jgi:hypothetical protein